MEILSVFPAQAGIQSYKRQWKTDTRVKNHIGEMRKDKQEEGRGSGREPKSILQLGAIRLRDVAYKKKGYGPCNSAEHFNAHLLSHIDIRSIEKKITTMWH